MNVSTPTVVLVNPPIRPEDVYGKEFVEWSALSVPTGLCYIAAMLRKNGIDVSIVDAEALKTGIKETAELVASKFPTIVGIACKTLWIINAHALASTLKQIIPDAVIVAGGNHATAVPKETLAEYPAFDYLVIGEGEITFLELVKHLDASAPVDEINGIAYRGADGIVITERRERIKDLDALPFPAFDLLPLPLKDYQASLLQVDRVPAVEVIYSRGCSGKCTFCDRSVFGREITWHSPAYIVDAIETLYRDHDIRGFMINDDNFFINKRRLNETLDLLIEKNLNLKFTCSSRVDCVDLEILKKAKRAGCTRVMYGVETGSSKIWKMMNKKINRDKVIKAVALTKQARLKSTAFIILGFPGETEETLNETVALTKALDFDDIGPFFFTPLPGSEIFPKITDYGRFDADWSKGNSVDKIVFVPNGLSEASLKLYYDRIIGACYFKWRQLFAIHKKVPTVQHFKSYCASFFKMFRRA
jgi:anaerobic magnesium-protoporphyrin IX monomethyl ester cyclase